MFETLAQITTNVIMELGLVQGSAVQIYTEPQVEHTIQKQLVTLVQKRFWKHLTHNTIHTLDGSSGVVTDTLDTIPSFEDIEWIRYSPYEKHNAFEPLNGSPYLSNMIYRYERIGPFEVNYGAKLFNVYPLDLDVPIMIRARRYKTSYLREEIIPFDAIALTHFVVGHMLAVEGLNASAEQRQNILFDQRYKDLISNEGNTVSRYGKDAPDTFRVAE